MAITTKKINYDQLNQELGGHGLCWGFTDDGKITIVPAENSPVTEKELATAIKEHVAQPSQNEITQLNREQGIVKLKELGFTDDQISALLNG
jgi:hypothetical protein